MNQTKSPSKHLAGAFDIRNVIAALLGIYGVVLVICSFALDPGSNPDTNVAKAGTDNLWAGIAMLVIAAAFFIWTKARPIVVDESTLENAADQESESRA